MSQSPPFFPTGLTPLNGEPYQQNPKGISLREFASFEPSCVKIR